MDVDLDGEWQGCRLRGRFLVANDGQRITRQRLEGLLWRDAMELRRAGYASRRAAEAAKASGQYRPKVKVVVIDLGEYRANGLAAG